MHAHRIQYVTGLKCIHCGRKYSTEEVDYYCPACGYHEGILDVQYDYDAVREELNLKALAGNRELSMWRYLPLLPVSSPELIPHLQVGWTPLYETPRLAGELGVARCWVKDEGRNPTASFKDRASAMGVVKALEKNAAQITCASTGNAASSLAGFAAAAGIPATIFVPARAPEAKVAQLLVYGARVFSVDGTYDEAWELCMKASAEFGWYNRNCAINPYLIEGKKTVSLELAEQFSRLTPGSAPDWVVVSVGDGCTIGGVWKGLREMHHLGILPRLPRILGVQAEAASRSSPRGAIAAAWHRAPPTRWRIPLPWAIRETSPKACARSPNPAAHLLPSRTKRFWSRSRCWRARPASLASRRAWPGRLACGGRSRRASSVAAKAWLWS